MKILDTIHTILSNFGSITTKVSRSHI